MMSMKPESPAAAFLLTVFVCLFVSQLTFSPFLSGSRILTVSWTYSDD